MPSIYDRQFVPSEVVDFYQPPKPFESGNSGGAGMPVATPSQNPTAISSNLMATGANTVPMRGVHPIEQMADTDLYRMFPYTAYYDRIWKYTFYSLFNTAR